MAKPSRVRSCGDAPPLVTVAMPVFNGGKHLKLAVLSILGQTFTDWELLIFDDGSSDGAVENILDLNDPRIRILRDGLNRGLAARLNEAIDLARGRYFARMDQDDIAYPERLARQIAMLEENPELDLVAVRCAAIGVDDKLVGALPYALAHEEVCATPWKGFYLAHPTWMGRMEWFRQHRYATPGPYFCEDQELLLRSYRNSRFATVPEILLAYRVRSRIDWRKSLRTRKTMLWIQLSHFFGMRQWHYGFYSAMVFVARVAMDTLNVLIQVAGRSGYYGYRIMPVESGEKTRWSAVLAVVGHGRRQLETTR